jgi:hypothetical protein
VNYPLEIQAKAEAEYFMVRTKLAAQRKDDLWIKNIATTRIQCYGYVQEPYVLDARFQCYYDVLYAKDDGSVKEYG